MTYRMILQLIAKGRIAGLRDKVDILYLDGRLTDAEYTDIMARITEAEK